MRNVLACLLSLFLATQTQAAEPLNLSRGVAVDGYDVVAYFQDGPVKGERSISAEYMNATYRFSSEENRSLFEQNPEQYLPEYGGYCAYAMLEGDTVDIDPESWKIVDGRLYLFYDGLFGDTRRKWNEMLADTPESELITTADSHWQGLVEND